MRNKFLNLTPQMKNLFLAYTQKAAVLVICFDNAIFKYVLIMCYDKHGLFLLLIPNIFYNRKL